GGRWVGMESNRATVSASYDRAWLDHLIFDVEVTNQSDSLLVVDPQQFSLTLSNPAGDLPRRLRQRFTPESPARVRARLGREAAVGLGITDAAMGMAGLVLGTAILIAVVEGGVDLSTDPTADCSTPTPFVDPLAVRREQARHARDSLPRT